MEVKVLFFGATADAVGEREATISFNGPVSAGDALSAIKDRFHNLRAHKLLFALNQEYVNGDEMIAEGDELAVFTAVSGG